MHNYSYPARGDIWSSFSTLDDPIWNMHVLNVAIMYRRDSDSQLVIASYVIPAHGALVLLCCSIIARRAGLRARLCHTK